MKLKNDAPVTLALLGAGTRGEFDLGYFMEKLRKKIRYTAVAETNPLRRETFVKRFKIPEKNVFKDWRDLVDKPDVADAVLNCLPSSIHYESTISALNNGYHVLLEKPMAHNPKECIKLVKEAKKYDRILAVCLENRYNKIYQETQKILNSGAIGHLYNIICAENIGLSFHFANSYVRGIHRSDSFMMAKGIHDLDLFVWFTQALPKKTSSFGELSYFKKENAPEGAPERCADGCPHSKNCKFNALRLYYEPGQPQIPISLILKSQTLRSFIDYFTNPRFRTLASVIVSDIKKPNILKALKEGSYGKCVFHSNNSAIDHQITNITFENDITCTFALNSFSLVWERKLDLHGVEGEIYTKDFTGELEVRKYNPASVKKQKIRYSGLHHGGGDEFMLLDFARAVKSGTDEGLMIKAENCLEAHLLGFAAEESRLIGKIIDFSEFKQRAEKLAENLY
ncbi:MAG: hypothetical protein COS84_02080 [Armatimonadetes bacterium CG07_land_8_20_14_0_80_40_9]|nr:MAG: hypothetical protein COS84_02080 [Armatimonadetes bacterium CG07_land_8_20_14_0_80_40_9]